MRALGILTLFSSALLVAAQNAVGPSEKDPIFITNPVESTDLKTGKTMTIEWTTFDKAPETVNIELLQDFALHSSIAEGIDTSAHEYEWTVPENLDTSNNYAIRIGDGSYTSYSHLFAIKGKGPLKIGPAGGSPATGASMTTAAASVSAASGSVGGQQSVAPLSKPSSDSGPSVSSAPGSTEDSVSSSSERPSSGSTKLSTTGVVGALAGVAAIAANL